MPEVDDLRSLRLKKTPHDIDGSIMPIEKGRRRNEPDFVNRGITHTCSLWQDTAKLTIVSEKISILSGQTFMRKLWLLFLAGGLNPSIAFTQHPLPPYQPEQDACGALPLCGGKYFFPYSYQGGGHVQDIDGNTPCWAGEANSVWFKFTIATTGILAFSIDPVDPKDDYDFALLETTGLACDIISSADVVRCDNNAGPFPGLTGGAVGLSDTATNPYVAGGTFGYSFAKTLNVSPGQSFLLLIENFGHGGLNKVSSGFTLDLTPSTAGFASAVDPAPQLQMTSIGCSDSSVTVRLSDRILCSSIASNGSDFSISPEIPITGATGVNCVGTDGYTSGITINFAGHFPPGDYNIVARTGSDGNTLLSLCGIPLALPTSIPFSIPSPFANHFLPPDTTKCNYSTIEILARTGFAGYQWSSGQTTPSIIVTDPGVYSLKVTDTSGCIAKDTITIRDSACPEYVFLPKAFTPNGDGHNDIFRPLFAGPAGHFHLVIYDRWGRQVFESKDPWTGWNGTAGGIAQPAGGYVWVCSYQLYQHPEQSQRGVVFLVR
jgi:gliding motility-associated-like protein